MEERCSNEITATGNQDYKRNISLGNNDYILSFGLGTPFPSKTDEFSEKFRKGGGVISNPKIILQNLDL